MYNYGIHDDKTSHVQFARIANQLRVLFLVNNYGNLMIEAYWNVTPCQVANNRQRCKGKWNNQYGLASQKAEICVYMYVCMCIYIYIYIYICMYETQSSYLK